MASLQDLQTLNKIQQLKKANALLEEELERLMDDWDHHERNGNEQAMQTVEGMMNRIPELMAENRVDIRVLSRRFR